MAIWRWFTFLYFFGVIASGVLNVLLCNPYWAFIFQYSLSLLKTRFNVWFFTKLTRWLLVCGGRGRGRDALSHSQLFTWNFLWGVLVVLFKHAHRGRTKCDARFHKTDGVSRFSRDNLGRPMVDRRRAATRASSIASRDAQNAATATAPKAAHLWLAGTLGWRRDHCDIN